MGDLLNLIGLSTGIALYAMLLGMVIRSGGTVPAGRGADPLLVATGVLGLVWNLCALPVYELLKVGVVSPLSALTAIGFTALGLLPAVAVHSVLRVDRGPMRAAPARVIVACAYLVSGVAAILHAYAWATDAPLPSPLAMQLLTYSFIILVAPLAIVTRGQQNVRRALWAAALSIFAVSALHLSQFHQGDPSWPVELLGHHASVPLAIAILYQDFPFAFADLFLKRALAMLVVVTLAFVSLIGLWTPATGAAAQARELGLLVTMWVATAMLYPKIREVVSWFVDTVVLRRPNFSQLLDAVRTEVLQHDEVPAVLNAVCRGLRPAFNATTVTWTELNGPSFLETAEAVTATRASVQIPVAESPHYALSVSGLMGGRRLLSDDREFLAAIARILGRRIDAIRIISERSAVAVREQEMAKLATEAELRALRSQINPHFLFNALTTIGFLIQTAPARALDTLLHLTKLLRGVLRSEGDMATLGRELAILFSYLDIERARFEDRLQVSIDVPESLRSLQLPPLLLQPLVENAVKHGIAPLKRGGCVTIGARLEGDSDSTLVLTVHDSGAGMAPAGVPTHRERGVGLKNIERRLQVHYGAQASLAIRSEAGRGTTAEVRLPARSHERTEIVVAGGR
jgi:signal transduction histidine kinase